MNIRVSIPATIRHFTKGAPEVSIPGDTVKNIFEYLDEDFPGIKACLFEDTGDLKKFVQVFKNDQSIFTIEGLDTKLNNNDRITILTASTAI